MFALVVTNKFQSWFSFGAKWKWNAIEWFHSLMESAYQKCQILDFNKISFHLAFHTHKHEKHIQMIKYYLLDTILMAFRGI